jgi:FemAB-related protein (PEP-CTERM system-associated)
MSAPQLPVSVAGPGSGAAPDGGVRVERFDGASAEWDAFVASAARSSFCHLAGWRDVMDGVLGHRSYPLAARDGTGRITGVLPLVHVRSRIFGTYLLSMPFLNYGGPIGEPEAVAALTGRALEVARELRVGLLELRCRGEAPAGMSVSHRKVTVTLDLPESVDALWKQTFRAKLRSQIRRPIKEGMCFRRGHEEVDGFYRVFARHMRDLGTPVLPRALFDALPAAFPGEVVFATVRDGDEPVAAGCGFVWGDEFELTWAASLRDRSRSAPNMLLYASLMEEMVGRGLRTFNFGRCTPGAGTHRFKLQWGGVDEPLPWAQWSSAGVASTPSPESAKFRLATAAWQRLPLPVANRVGPVLARQIP